MRIKFLHAADLHLDSPFAALPPEQAARRRREQRELLGQIVELCNGEQCDPAVIGRVICSTGPRCTRIRWRCCSAAGPMPGFGLYQSRQPRPLRPRQPLCPERLAQKRPLFTEPSMQGSSCPIWIWNCGARPLPARRPHRFWMASASPANGPPSFCSTAMPRMPPVPTMLSPQPNWSSAAPTMWPWATFMPRRACFMPEKRPTRGPAAPWAGASMKQAPAASMWVPSRMRGVISSFTPWTAAGI